MYNFPMTIRMARSVFVLAALWLTVATFSPALTAQTPPGAGPTETMDRAKLREELFRALKNARSEPEADAIANQIWAFWMQGPDPEATEQMAQILAARQAHDLEKALELANALVARRPDYSEGWNQQATLLFMKHEYDASLEAVERVLELEPKHFGALAGKATILIHQGKMPLAQAALRAAVAIHPFLRERQLLIKPKGVPI